MITATNIIILICVITSIGVFWLWLYPAYINSKSKQKKAFSTILEKYRAAKTQTERKELQNAQNELNRKIAQGLDASDKTPNDNTTIPDNQDNEPLPVIPHTSYRSRIALQIKDIEEERKKEEEEEIEAGRIFNETHFDHIDGLINNFDDGYFVWGKDGSSWVLYATKLIEKQLGSSRIKYSSYKDCTASVQICLPNEIGETILIMDANRYGIDVRYEYPISFDTSYLIEERYLISEKHSSHAPFPVLRLTTEPSAVASALREQKEQEEQLAILAEQRAREKKEQEWREVEDQLLEKHRRRQLVKKVEASLIERGEIHKEAKRPRIPRDMADAVYSRDGGKCVYCGSTENLHFDHVIPFSKGGATNIENLQILCQKCNLEKSNHIG